MHRVATTTGGRIKARLASTRVRVFVLILLALLPVAAWRTGDLLAARTELVSRANQRALALAREGAELQEDLITRADTLLDVLGEVASVREARAGECDAFLNRIALNAPWQVGILIARPDGRVACAGGPPGAVGIDLSDRAYFARALAATGTVVGDYILTRLTGTPAFVVARTLRDPEGGPVSVAIISVDLQWVNRLAAQAGQAAGAAVLMVDSQGTVLARHPDPKAYVGRSVRDAPFAGALLGAREGNFEHATAAGGVRITGFTTVRRTENRIAVGLMREAVLAEADREMRRSLLLFAGLVAGAMVLAALGAHLLFVRWIDRLAAAAGRIGAGDFSSPAGVPAAAGDLAVVGRALDLAAARLEQRQQELEATTAALRQREAELAESADRLRALTDNLPGVVYQRRLHPDGRMAYTYFGDTIRRLAGISPEEGIADAGRLLERVHPDDRARFQATVAEAARTRSDIAVEFRFLDGEGRWLWARTAATMRPSPDGGAIWDGLTIDVSALKSAQEAAEAASRAKSDFLAAVSHEIRTPLNAIIGFGTLLTEGDLGERERRHARTVRDAARNLLTIVNEILDFAKIEEGRVDLEAVPVAPRDLAGEVLALFRPGAAERGLALDLAVAPAVPAFVTGDPARLRQVLVNLVGNAVKFTERGGVLVGIGAGAGDDRLRITIADSGIGIPPERRPALFQRFSQIEASTTRRFGGTGLGLAICKELVELMGGEIGVESTPGRGSTFWVELPLPETAPPPRPTVEAGATAHRRGLRVLLVEDVAMNRELVLELLAPDGHAIATAENGAEAVQAVQTRPFDVVLMDIQMPVMDGIEAASAIRALPGEAAGVPIVALTANVLPAVLARCRAAGMNGHLAKPVTRDDLVRAIDAHAAGGGEAPGAPVHTALGCDLPPALLARFLADLLARLDRLDAGVAPAELEGEAHRLVSTAGQLGFLDLSRRCRALMEACMQGEEVGPHLAAVRGEAERVRPRARALEAGLARAS